MLLLLYGKGQYCLAPVFITEVRLFSYGGQLVQVKDDSKFQASSWSSLDSSTFYTHTQAIKINLCINFWMQINFNLLNCKIYPS